MTERTLCSRKLVARTVLPLLVTPNVLPRQAYVSNDSLDHIQYKLECVLTGDVLDAFREYTKKDTISYPIFLDIEHWDKALITIPLWGIARNKDAGISIFDNAYFKGINLLYGNLLWGVLRHGSTNAILDTQKYGFFRLPPFNVVINGVKSLPCALCPNFKQGQVCLYKTKGYQCLFTSGLELKTDDTEMLSAIISTGSELPDMSYEDWEQQWFEEHPDVPKMEDKEEDA